MLCCIFVWQNVRFCFTGFGENSDLVIRVLRISGVREPLCDVNTSDLQLDELTNGNVPDVTLSDGLEIPIWNLEFLFGPLTPSRKILPQGHRAIYLACQDHVFSPLHAILCSPLQPEGSSVQKRLQILWGVTPTNSMKTFTCGGIRKVLS
jgi:hypothetical protein